MALTYGFYNSLSGDRKYNSVQISEMFDGIINDGIYEAIGDWFVVRATSDMGISVGTGRAFFNHTWTKNDAPLLLEVPESNLLLNRIDTVVLEVNSDPEVRENFIKIVSGEPATEPTAPEMVHTKYVNQYPLAEIYVGADVSAITQSNITNKIGTSTTPFVTGIITVLDITALLGQWESQFDEWNQQKHEEFETWETDQKAGFIAWFDGIKGHLSGDIGGELQLEIDDLSNRIGVKGTSAEIDAMIQQGLIPAGTLLYITDDEANDVTVQQVDYDANTTLAEKLDDIDDDISEINTTLTNKLKRSNKTVPVVFSNSNVGNGSVSITDLGATYIYSVTPSSSAQDVIATQINSNTLEVAIGMYRPSGAVTATVNCDVTILYRT